MIDYAKLTRHHDLKLIRAAQRHGKPFKCGPVFLLREVVIKGAVTRGPKVKVVRP